jgi:hypothetical protein
MKDEKKYEYQTGKDVLSDFLDSFDDLFEPIYASFRRHKKNYILQIVNFVLFFILIKHLLGGLLGFIVKSINGGNIFGVSIFLLILLIIFVSVMQKNKVLKWQTLFKTEYSLTKKILAMLVAINIFVYYLKDYYGRKIKN